VIPPVTGRQVQRDSCKYSMEGGVNITAEGEQTNPLATDISVISGADERQNVLLYAALISKLSPSAEPNEPASVLKVLVERKDLDDGAQAELGGIEYHLMLVKTPPVTTWMFIASANSAKEDAAREAARRAEEEAANPQIYWLDYDYSKDGAFGFRALFLRNKDAGLVLPEWFDSLASCKARASSILDVPGRAFKIERAECIPTAVTLQMINTEGDACGGSDRQGNPRIYSQACKDARKPITKVLELEIKAK
jgi:hypothetical protein